MKFHPKMGDNTKQVRVDNWGIFFLQRLQMFFSKTDYCDMTLQFEGNVQLKVHRLVINACTEYFQFLEQTCALEENVIMMPSDLQADVIVPIVNFMYTGMLEFHLNIFDRLYKTAQVMNITILTKLLDAQKQPMVAVGKPAKKKLIDMPHGHNFSEDLRTRTQSNIYAGKKSTPKLTHHHSDLPATLPGRKLPIWKRKSIPTPTQPHSHSASQLSYADPKWSPAIDPLSLPDNTPKPTRFEWPDDDLPPLSLMDTSFEEISYTSKPLLTQEEEHRASTSFDDLKHIPNANRVSSSSKKRSSPTLDMEEMKNYVKEQKIRSGLSQDDGGMDRDSDLMDDTLKRKATDQRSKGITKKVRFDEQENKTTTTTISIATDGKNAAELDHEKIVTEILKKYPQLVKKNKNIKLKIMAKNKTTPLESTRAENVQTRSSRLKVQMAETLKVDSTKSNKSNDGSGKTDNKVPWVCERCSTDDEPVEFVLYYLYRKHMTDVHNEKFDPKLCKYCGQRCNKNNLLMYHLYTKHGMKPPPTYNFPKCDQCPFIALSSSILSKHKMRHSKNEIQCVECKLAFTSQATLTSHMQITGHTGKSNKNNYDCQYCTKRYQSGVNLFSHVRMQHRNEAIRDGIVSIDEVDDVEDFDEEDTSKEEYILPEIMTDQEPRKKVNVLSNVKVEDHCHQDTSHHHQVALEPSSEAEALNNVATGIATSLGLVDIVVINENQQLFLQSDQQNFSNDQNEQPEFILPELTGRETFSQNQSEVITDGVIAQSMLSSGDIGSTDELVMVLTDHDYGDNQEEINNDNSNIVVLYSHPVNDQQEQFITSQGNIMVNSQTGLFEIRNGATITSTVSQVVSPPEPHIESIEMIQREIDSHGDFKQESGSDEDSKPRVEATDKSDVELQTKESEDVQESNPQQDHVMETLNQGEQLEFTSSVQPLDEPQQSVCETPAQTTLQPGEEAEVNDRIEETGEHERNEEAEEQQRNEEAEEQQHLEETEDQQRLEEAQENGRSAETEAPNEIEENQTEHEIEDKVVSEVEPELSTEMEPEDITRTEDETASEAVTETEAEKVAEFQTPERGPSLIEESSAKEDKSEELNEDESIPPQDEERENKEVEEENKSDSPQLVSQETENEDKATEDNPNINLEEHTDEIPEEEKNQEENSGEQELSPSDTSTSQFNDEGSQSSQESQQREHQQETMSAKISILDDWEDTDSQQSDQKEKAKVAGETVHKLMDDWEEEDEDDSKKEAEVL